MTIAVQRIDQRTIRRSSTGLRTIDHLKLFPGYTLLTPLTGQEKVYLLNLKGLVVHEWRLPYPLAASGYLLPNGNLFYNGKLPDASIHWSAGGLVKGGVVVEVNCKGKIVWEYRHPDHHDACRLQNGNTLILCLEKLPRSLIPQIQGGIPGTELDGEMYADVIHEVTPSGEIVWSWHAYKYLDSATDVINSQNHRCEWTHGNSVRELANGEIILSFQNISTVVIVDRHTNKIIWKLGRDVLAQPHFPHELPNGNILIFDNRDSHQHQTLNYSRVIEVDRDTKEVVWEYTDHSPQNFSSLDLSSAQRLPNGNTLITQGSLGRVFEITPDGELVWEYINPQFGQASLTLGAQNSIARAFRYTRAEISWL
jgi:hypothetical protein